MGDAAKGIKAFKKGLAEEDKPETPVASPTIDHQPTATAAPQPAPTATAATPEQTPASAPKVG
ncbi:MAG: hypothetical protein FD152_2037 [Xanthobacteraceae bacterium]|nr:MAG: hypothetical protein FD152_2037 [Xanthobacteraceae bacterium]